jgi:hypothetical protein
MKMYGEVDVYIHVFLTLVLVEAEWPTSRSGYFIHGTHWIGGWVDPMASLDAAEKIKFLTLLGLELRPVSHPACSKSLS